MTIAPIRSRFILGKPEGLHPCRRELRSVMTFGDLIFDRKATILHVFQRSLDELSNVFPLSLRPLRAEITREIL